MRYIVISSFSFLLHSILLKKRGSLWEVCLFVPNTIITIFLNFDSSYTLYLPLAPIIFKDIIYITEKLQNDVIQRDTLNKIAIKLSLKAGLDNDCLNNIDPSCIPSKMIYEWDDSTCIGKFGSNGPSDRGESKLVLAQLIMEVADSIEDIKQKDILEILVRRLDMYYKIHHG